MLSERCLRSIGFDPSGFLSNSRPHDLVRKKKVFLYDVTTAMLVSQNKEMAAMLVSQTKPLGIELYFHANPFVCFSKPI